MQMHSSVRLPQQTTMTRQNLHLVITHRAIDRILGSSAGRNTSSSLEGGIKHAVSTSCIPGLLPHHPCTSAWHGAAGQDAASSSWCQWRPWLGGIVHLDSMPIMFEFASPCHVIKPCSSKKSFSQNSSSAAFRSLVSGLMSRTSSQQLCRLTLSLLIRLSITGV